MAIDRRGRTFARDVGGGTITTSASVVPIHAETVLGSGTFDAAIDLRPVRITSAGRDLWAINDNQFTFALGERSATSGDGWIGFGGRRGQNAFWSRLQSVGYLHWPTRTWRDLGGAPTYARGNLSAERASAFTLGRETFSRKARALWQDLWPALPAGQIDLELSIGGNGVKEFIRVDAAARNWIRANRPPLTPASETWFGFMWELDWSDIPRIYRGGVLVGAGEDFDDTLPVEIRDALDRLLGIFPIGACWIEGIRRADIVNGRFSRGQVFRPVQKRFWTEGGTPHFAIGIRCDLLANMAPGDLVIDPPQVVDTATGNDCGQSNGVNTFDNNGTGASGNMYIFSNVEAPCFRFDMTAMTGGAVTAAALTWDWGNDDSGYGSFTFRVDAHDVAAAPAFAGASFHSFRNWVATTANTEETLNSVPANGDDESIDVAAIVSELVASFGDTITTLAMRVWDPADTGDYQTLYDDSNATFADPQLTVSQAAGGGGSILRQMMQYS